MKDIKHFLLKRKYERARTIYLIFCWVKYGILEAKWTGDIDADGHPLTIHYSDCNGEGELYYIAPWYKESTGIAYGYSFNKAHAKNIVERLNGKKV